MSTHIDALGDVYARSLIQLAEQAGGAEKVQEIGDELAQVVELGRADKRFREFLVSPIVSRTDRDRSIQTIFSDRVSDLTLRFLLLLNRRSRLNHLESISTAYEARLDEAHGRVEVDVITPTPPTQQQLDQIADIVRQRTKREPVIHTVTDPSMLGGMKLRIGDELIDGSLSSRLRRVRQNMLEGGAAAIRGRMADMFGDTD